MNGDERVLLDSVILIDHFNGIAAATTYLRGVVDRASISAVTRAEVLTGFDVSGAATIRRLLDRFGLIAIDRDIADLAAQLRREHGWKLPDALQAAAAQTHSMILATRNTRDFDPMSRHAFVAIPYAV